MQSWPIVDIPALPGREAFPGAVLHSTAFTAAEAAGVRGKHVVVVGGAKSALDCALAAAGAGGAQCGVHWMELMSMPSWCISHSGDSVRRRSTDVTTRSIT